MDALAADLAALTDATAGAARSAAPEKPDAPRQLASTSPPVDEIDLPLPLSTLDLEPLFSVDAPVALPRLPALGRRLRVLASPSPRR